MGFRYKLSNILRKIFTQECLICKTLLTNGEIICSKCESSMIPASETKCKYCERALSKYIYDGNAKMLMLKYKFGDDDYYEYYKDILTRWLIEVYSKELSDIKFDFVVSVPAFGKEHPRFEGIAKDFASECDIPYSGKLLVKKRETLKQHDLHYEERCHNLTNAFEASANVKDKTILLVDDIITTGNTIEECAKTLKEAGAQKVFALSVLKTAMK